jgi:hypothetical protein
MVELIHVVGAPTPNLHISAGDFLRLNPATTPRQTSPPPRDIQSPAPRRNGTPTAVTPNGRV